MSQCTFCLEMRQPTLDEIHGDSLHFITKRSCQWYLFALDSRRVYMGARGNVKCRFKVRQGSIKNERIPPFGKECQGEG